MKIQKRKRVWVQQWVEVKVKGTGMPHGDMVFANLRRSVILVNRGDLVVSPVKPRH